MAESIGIALSDDRALLAAGNGQTLSVSMAVSRDIARESWQIGEEAYRRALGGTAVLRDHLLRMVLKDASALLAGTRYTGLRLMKEFFTRLIGQVSAPETFSELYVTVCIRTPDRKLMDLLSGLLTETGIRQERLSIISCSEAFACYVLGQNPELYRNASVLFDISEEGLHYYELRFLRGSDRKRAVVRTENLETDFNMNLLRSEEGRSRADRILTEAGRKQLGKMLCSSAFLTGTGFSDITWAEEFKAYIVRNRKVLLEPLLYAFGALEQAKSKAQKAQEELILYCDTTVDYELSLRVTAGGCESRLMLTVEGDRWYGADIHAELMLCRQDFLELEVSRPEKGPRSETIRIPADSFPKRPDRCTRLSLDIRFEGARNAQILLKDMGFGEIYPASGIVVTREIVIP